MSCSLSTYADFRSRSLWLLFFSPVVLPTKHKRPEGQNLRGCDKSALDFEVEFFGVVGLTGGQPALVSEVLAGSPTIEFCTRPSHVRHLPHPEDRLAKAEHY